MARDVTYQKNPWGTQGGEEPQRADLWMIDLGSAVRNLSSVLGISIPVLRPYYAQSVTMPELVVRPDTFRRDSRPYHMPSTDDPPGPVRVVFLLDARDAKSSEIYKVLDAWRSVVRAGRGGTGAAASVLLNSHSRIAYDR